VSTTWLVISLGVFVALYLTLLVVDFWLMRRYARLDPTGAPEEGGEIAPAAAAVVGY
jgi:cytochrome bd-type quinol oxidase subunit 1